jgi:hypothetical protein
MLLHAKVDVTEQKQSPNERGIHSLPIFSLPHFSGEKICPIDGGIRNEGGIRLNNGSDGGMKE